MAIKKKIGKRPPKVTSLPQNTGRFIRVYDNEPNSRFEEVGRLVIDGKLKWICHKKEGNTGYHYYKKIK